MHVFCGVVVELDETGAVSADFIFFGVVGFFDDGNTSFIGEFFDSIDEGEVFVFHDKADGATRFAAAEAVEPLALWANGKGRGAFVVEGAKCLELAPGSFYRNIGADQLHNISGSCDSFYGFFRYFAHGLGMH